MGDRLGDVSVRWIRKRSMSAELGEVRLTWIWGCACEMD